MSIIEILSTIFRILIYAGIVQGIYSAFLLSHTKLRNPANHLLAILMVVLSFSILHSTFIIPYFHEFHNTSFHIKEPFILLVVPFIWLYVKKLNDPLFRFTKKHLLHFLPFLIVMIFSAFLLFRHSPLSNSKNLENHALVFNIILYIIALCQYCFYLVYIFRSIRSFRIKTLNELSNTENTDLAWLRIFLITFLLVILLLIIMMVAAIHSLNIEHFNEIGSVIFALMIYVLGYKGLFQQTILPEKATKPDRAIITNEKYVPGNQADDRQLRKVLDFMSGQKPYCDPELTLTSLASQIGVSRNQLSEIINAGAGINFYEFVNNYRVNEVKRLMSNPRYKDYTILALAFEAGFPSKSTFNSFFKKHTGITPSGYRNSLL